MQEIVDRTAKVAESKGFTRSNRTAGDLLCLVHSEVSEALEDFRAYKMDLYYEEDGKPCGFPSEIADIIIRCLHICKMFDIDIEKVIDIKLDYNETRSMLHGGKRI